MHQNKVHVQVYSIFLFLPKKQSNKTIIGEITLLIEQVDLLVHFNIFEYILSKDRLTVFNINTMYKTQRYCCG